MKKQGFVCALVTVCTLLCPLALRSEVVDKIVAIVNDDIVTMGEVQKSVHVEKQGTFTTADDYFRDESLREKLDSFIEAKLIQQQAKKMKIEVSDKEVESVAESIRKQNLVSEKEMKERLEKEGINYKAFLEGIRNNLLQNRVLARAIGTTVIVSEADLKQYYDENPDQFKSEEFRLQQIFISSRREDASARAQAAFNKLQQGESFEALARQYSDDPSSIHGGDIGFVKKEELLPQLLQAISLLMPGTSSHPITTPFGYHIIKLVETRKSEAVPFDSVKDSIKARILQQETQKRFKEYIGKLRTSSYIEVKI
ncbi:MAG TPA: peptidyl-prolyl cis-trans isomerase [Syntrophorhabdales bacterium]|nr:peptidyl-prolyl cis-trans isomerase [Syntrophorhabdales bacterium]